MGKEFQICQHAQFAVRRQMPQRLPISLGQVKAGNTSENLLNKIREIMYSLYRAKQISKNIYNNIMNSMKL